MWRFFCSPTVRSLSVVGWTFRRWLISELNCCNFLSRYLISIIRSLIFRRRLFYIPTFPVESWQCWPSIYQSYSVSRTLRLGALVCRAAETFLWYLIMAATHPFSMADSSSGVNLASCSPWEHRHTASILRVHVCGDFLAGRRPKTIQFSRLAIQIVVGYLLL